MILWWVWKESTPDSIVPDTYLLPFYARRDFLCHRCVWTVTDWKESSSVTSICADSLGSPKEAVFISLGSLSIGWKKAPQNNWDLLEYILCVNGFQLFSLLILMQIKTHKNILLRTIHIPCGILLYFIWVFYGLGDFNKEFLFFFVVLFSTLGIWFVINWYSSVKLYINS